jgi:amino acid transporter
VTVVALAPSRGTAITADGFSLSGAVSDPSAMFRALVFALLGFCGFDVVSTLAEETRTARKLIPQATILSLFLYAVLIVGGMWALTFGGNAAHLKEIADSGRVPITEVATSFWGRGSILINITALTATLALIIATSLGASRILFSKGRRGAAPALFARLHSSHQVPWNALHFIFGGGIVATFVAFAFLGSYKAYEWWCNTSVFFAMLTFFFGNLCAILLNRHRLKSFGGILLYGAVPVIGMAVDLYVLAQSFFISLWGQPWATGKSVVATGVITALATLVLALAVKRTQPLNQV